MAQRPGGKGFSSEDMNSHLVSLPRSPPSLVGDLWYYISLPFVHPLPTLLSHPCPYLSTHPIGHSFWCFVSCCGLDSTVQGSRPHKWGQDVSCGYLIRRWQLLLELLFYHTPMAGPLGSKLPLGCSRGLPLAAWCFPLLWFWSAKDRVVLDSISWQSRFPLFVLGHFFLLSVGLGLDMKWAGVLRSFGPTIAPQNLVARLLERGGGFWCSQAYVMASWVLFPYVCQGLFAYPRYASGVLAYEVHCH